MLLQGDKKQWVETPFLQMEARWEKPTAAAARRQPHNRAELTLSRHGVQEHAAAEQTAHAVHQPLFNAAGAGVWQ